MQCKRQHIIKLCPLLFIFFFITCTKESFNIKPQGSFLSANPQTVSLSRPITIHEDDPKMLSLIYSFQDSDGNINDLSLTKKIINVRATEIANFKQNISLNVSWPNINKQNSLKGTINFLLSYIEIGGPTRANIDDTVRFILVLKDSNGNESDSIVSEPITILRSGR